MDHTQLSPLALHVMRAIQGQPLAISEQGLQEAYAAVKAIREELERQMVVPAV